MMKSHRSFLRLLLFLCGWAAAAVLPAQPRLVLAGDYPDPSVLRDGKDFYMTHSPFYYSPGFLIWHSTDLVRWKPVARALTQWKGSAMAPDLVKHGTRYYLYFPSAGTIYVSWADHIGGPWSEPIDLHLRGIDPGHVATPDGRRYLYTSEGVVAELSPDGLSAVSAQQKVYDGWTYPADWVTECMCLESPKLFRRGDYYYMVSAEGGTAGPATSHMAVVARARSVTGPWEKSPYNPLVHTYSAAEEWWSTGHATLVDDADGRWLMLYHAYRRNAYPLGRQTLLEPVAWTDDGWPVPALWTDADAITPAEGPWAPLSDTFAAPTLGWQWTFWKEHAPDALRFDRRGLTVQGKGSTPADGRLLLTTPTDTAYRVETELTASDGGRGGLVLFYNEKAFAGVVVGQDSLTLYRDATHQTHLPWRGRGPIRLRLSVVGGRMEVSACQPGKPWKRLDAPIDISRFHHNEFKGFYALRPALVSVGRGSATFRQFVYQPQP
jgi:beta-xylosidase